MLTRSFHPVSILAMTMAISLSALSWSPVWAQCGGPNDPNAECPPDDQERKEKKQPTAVPPTHTPTFTSTPEPTFTPTSTPTHTPTSTPTLPSMPPLAPPAEPPEESPSGAGWLPPLVAGFGLLLGLGILGYRWYANAQHAAGGGEGKASFSDLDLLSAGSEGAAALLRSRSPRKNPSRRSGKDADTTIGLDVDGGSGPLNLHGDPEAHYEPGSGVDFDATLEPVPPFEYEKDDVRAELNTGQHPTVSGPDMHLPPQDHGAPGVGTRYTLFSEDGTPTRPATNLELNEADKPAAPRKTPARDAGSSDTGDGETSEADEESS